MTLRNRLRPSAAPEKSHEIRVIRLAGQEVRYCLKRSAKRRTIALQIGGDGLEVSAPFRVGERQLDAVLREKSQWVLNKLRQAQANRPPPVHWMAGAALPLRGAVIFLHVRRGERAAALRGNRLQLTLPDPGDAAARAAALQWYRGEALADFLHRTHLFAHRLGTAPTRVSLSDARTRWGSCNATGAVRLNWRLIKAPPFVIDYVVAHELAHLIEYNHSPAFWRVVARICPAYREARHDLRRSAAGYHAF
ncbi:MAG TPA: M48 family peptidase [Betaproteobacteria bacterium]|nr:M48 family peptidase [Betaproteobacteria bacterium]